MGINGIKRLSQICCETQRIQRYRVSHSEIAVDGDQET